MLRTLYASTKENLKSLIVKTDIEQLGSKVESSVKPDASPLDLLVVQRKKWLKSVKKSRSYSNSESLQILLGRSEAKFYKPFPKNIPVNQLINPKKKKNYANDLNNKFIAIDCEMINTTKSFHYPARVSLVNYYGEKIIDTFVEPDSKVKNYNTRYSGITESVLRRARSKNNIFTREQVANMVLDIVESNDSVLLGHGIQNDIKALQLRFPRQGVMDTQDVPSVSEPVGKALKKMMQHYFKMEIQKGKKGHDSLEDARSCMLIFRAFQPEFHQRYNREYLLPTPANTQKDNKPAPDTSTPAATP